MYGEGFTCRRTRYTSNGSYRSSRSKRCASTTWKMSPARMYSFAASTAAWKPPFGMVEWNGGSSVSSSGGGGRGRRRVRQRPSQLVDQRVEARHGALVGVGELMVARTRGDEHVLDQ